MGEVPQYRAWRNEGRIEEALALARRAIPRLDAGELTQLSRLLVKDLGSAESSGPRFTVRLAGQCTTTFLPPFLTAWAWASGVGVSVSEAPFDQMVQDLMAQRDAPEAIVLLPWHDRLLADDPRGTDERVSGELAMLETAWAEVARLKSKLVQVAYDWTGPGPLGYSLSARCGGAVGIVEQANRAVRSALPAGAFFVDLPALSGWHGRSRFYDERNAAWFRQPFSNEGLSMLARHVAAGLRALSGGRKKVLVLDLDGTLWGGVVGESGPHGIVIGGAGEGGMFTNFQRFVRQLRDSGVLLAVSSKNNDEDAREPFEVNGEMVLKLGDFAAFHASWHPKPVQLQHLAEDLNLGVDSFVFFDDNPAERERMRVELPEVTVVEVPDDPAGYVRALQESLAFEAVEPTAADAARAGQYAAESARREAKTVAASPAGYFASLAMRAVVEPVSVANLDRVVDLITKTNQFNLTTRRHSRSAVEAMVATDGSHCLAVRLADAYGDYGLIAVVLALPDGAGVLHLDTWLMSCRAMGRTVEQFTLNHVVRAAREAGVCTLTAEIRPTAKNVPVRSLLSDCGFAAVAGSDGRWVLDLDVFQPLETAVAAGDL